MALVAGAAAASLVFARLYPSDIPPGLLLVLAVLASGVRFGLLPSLAASAAAAACLDFFFLEPVHEFRIARATDVAAFSVFCLVAATASKLAAAARDQAAAADQRASSLIGLYGLCRSLAAALTEPEAVEATKDGIARTLQASVSIRAGQTLAPAEDGARTFAVAASGWTIDATRAAGRFTQAERDLADAMGRLLDLALARLRLGERLEEARLSEARLALTSTLLDAIAHDLRSPLAGISAAAQSLQSAPEARTAETSGWLAVIDAESERLNRLVANLVGMIRIEGPAPGPKGQTTDLVDAVNAVVDRFGRLLRGRGLRVEIEPGTPFVRLDLAVFEQAMFNVLDNAARFSPEGSTIEVVARRVGSGAATVSVLDRGPGVPPDQLERIFEKFVRLPPPDGSGGGAGLGLGLAVTRGLLSAAGASITAANRTDGPGLAVTIALPAAQADAASRARALELTG